MRKSIVLILLPLLFCGIGKLSSQNIVLTDTPSRHGLTLTSTTDKVGLELDLEMSYNTANGNIVVNVTPKSSTYDMIWFPSKKSGRSDIRAYTSSHLGSKAWLKYRIRSAARDGVGPAFECRNAVVIEYPENEMLKAGESMHYEFHVVNQDKPVSLKIAAAAPVVKKQTMFGTRFVYVNVAKSGELNITVKKNPCLLKENQEIINGIKGLVNDTRKKYEILKDYEKQGHQKAKECVRMQSDIAKVQPQYEQWRNRIDASEMKCNETEEQIKALSKLITDAASTKCHYIQPTACSLPTNEVLRKTTNIENCRNKIKVGVDVNANCDLGLKLIAETESLIKSAKPDGCTPSERAKFEDARKAFNSMKQTFKRTVDRRKK